MSRILLRGAQVITMAPDRPDAERINLLVEGDRIAEVGEYLDPAGAEIVELAGGIIIPGLVNAHLHTWQTGMRFAALTGLCPSTSRTPTARSRTIIGPSTCTSAPWPVPSIRSTAA